jgi:nucleotide-binding universal stress UspA family protein
MRLSDADVAVFIDKEMQPEPRRLLLPYTGTSHDRAALRLAIHLARRTKAALTVLHVVRPGRSEPTLEIEVGRRLGRNSTEQLGEGATVQLSVVESHDPVDAVLDQVGDYDLVIVGIGDEWNLTPGTLGVRQERIAAETPTSLLLVRGAPQPSVAGDQGKGRDALSNA